MGWVVEGKVERFLAKIDSLSEMACREKLLKSAMGEGVLTLASARALIEQQSGTFLNIVQRNFSLGDVVVEYRAKCG